MNPIRASSTRRVSSRLIDSDINRDSAAASNARHFPDETQTRCRQADNVERFLAGELSDDECNDLEEHLDRCESCRQQLDRCAASEPEWSEVRQSLGSDQLAAIESFERSKRDELECFKRLLGPTDDPRMMGRIGTYEVLGVLGRGGMGVVFKAFDGALHRYVAIKLLAPMFLASGEAKQRFIREAQSAAAVVHEHVVGIHAISDWQGTPYLVMTYVRGESLQKRLATRGRLTLREVLRIGMQIASGLAAAHAQGLIHRDIKPGNILLESDVDRVKLTDFGLARAIDGLRLTGSDTLLGTPEYMSPEQARDEPLDFRSDLFSLGSVLFEASTGQSPFHATTGYGAIRKVIEHAPPLVNSLQHDLPNWFAVLIERLMQKDRRVRFESASEVAAVLQKCLAHLEQPQLAAVPKSLLKSRARERSATFIRRLKMSAPWIVGAVAGSWLLVAQLGQSAPPEDNPNPAAPSKVTAATKKPSGKKVAPTKPGKPAANEAVPPVVNAQPKPEAPGKIGKFKGPVVNNTMQPTAQADGYTLKVRRAQSVDAFQLALKPTDPTKMMLNGMNGVGGNAGGNIQQGGQVTQKSSSGGFKSSSSQSSFSTSSGSKVGGATGGTSGGNVGGFAGGNAGGNAIGNAGGFSGGNAGGFSGGNAGGNATGLGNGTGNSFGTSNGGGKSGGTSGGTTIINGQVVNGGNANGGGANGVQNLQVGNGFSFRPNLGIAFDIEPNNKVLFELTDLSAINDQDQPVAAMNPALMNFFDPQFEKATPGATAYAYFEQPQATAALKSISGKLQVTPGQIIVCEFPNGAPATKRVDNRSFTLKNLESNQNGVQVSLVLPPSQALAKANPFGDPQAFMRAMLMQQGAFEVTMHDDAGNSYYSTGSSGGGGFSGGNAGGFGNGFPNGINPNAQNQAPENAQSFGFAALPQDRKIQSIRVRMTERTGETKSIPFKFETVPVPYGVQR